MGINNQRQKGSEKEGPITVIAFVIPYLLFRHIALTQTFDLIISMSFPSNNYFS